MAPSARSQSRKSTLSQTEHATLAAARQGDPAAVAAGLAAAPASAEVIDPETGYSALMQAAQKGHLNVVRPPSRRAHANMRALAAVPPTARSRHPSTLMLAANQSNPHRLVC